MAVRIPWVREQAARVILRTVGVDLTPEFEAALFDGAREKIVYGGWRSGKSTEAASEVMIDIPLQHLVGPALYWILGPDYGQTEQEYNYLVDWCGRLNLILSNSAPLEGPRRLELKGGLVVETKSAQYTERLGSVAPDMIIACEAGQLSDEVRIWLQGRSMEKRCRIIYTGTLEDESNHPHWAWYPELGHQWMQDCNAEHSAYSLPSWSNLKVFPEGRTDPEILARETEWREYTGGDYTFLRRIAGIPTGIQYQVYPQLDATNLLIELKDETLTWIGSAGGIDWGTVHPSALCVVQQLSNGIAIVRECVVDENIKDRGNPDWIRSQHQRLSHQWRCYDWGTDPNEKFLARSYDAKAVSGSSGSREARIGLITARLNSGRLYFDQNGPGVLALYEEMRKVHRRKTRSGEIVLQRVDDDRTAALEDAIEIMDGFRKRELPKLATFKRPAYRRKREFSRV